MREAVLVFKAAVLIFKKDVRRFRFPLCGYLGLQAIFAWLEAGSPRRPGLQSYAWFCEILLLLAAWYLAVMVAHQETLPGDRQYWLTRPVSWQSLLLSKAAFVAAFFQVPVLASNLSTLVANGLPPLAYVAPLLVKQVFLTAFLVLPTLALAAVTRNFGQFAIWVFAAFAAVLLIGLEFPGASLGGSFWVIESAVGVVSLMALTGLLLWQYARRRTVQSQVILGAGLLVCAAAPAWNLWHGAFALESRYAHHPAEAAAIHLGFDAARDLKPGRGALGTWHGTESMVRFLLPVQVTGIPAGMEILSERIAVTAEGPAGARWSSGWTELGGTLRPTGDNWLLPEDGAYWQYFHIDRAFFERTRNAPLHLRTTTAFTLLSAARTIRLTPPAVAQPVPDFGFCAARANFGGMSSAIGGSLSVACLAPFQHADWVSLRMQSRRTGQFVISGTRQEVSYSPYPTALSAGLWKPAGAAWLAHDPSDLDIVLEARHAEAHFERALEVREIRLDQYRDTPPGAIR
jgi:hypothetical protein